MTDPASIAIIALAFIAGGFVKGLAGVGLPVVTIALLTFAFGLPNAMALMIVPGLLTNVWQTRSGGNVIVVFKRIRSFLVPALVAVWFGTRMLVAVDPAQVVVGLGLVLIVYALVNLSGFVVKIPARREPVLGPIFGIANGLVTGMTGVSSTPSVIYLNGLGLSRQAFIQSMGLLFLTSYVVLSLSLWLEGVISPHAGALSFFAVLPALAGMILGQKLRQKTSDSGFKRVLNFVLLAIGAYLIVRALAI